MKKFFHAPGLILIAFCGLVAALIGWETAEDWLAARYESLWKECQ